MGQSSWIAMLKVRSREDQDSQLWPRDILTAIFYHRRFSSRPGKKTSFKYDQLPSHVSVEFSVGFSFCLSLLLHKILPCIIAVYRLLAHLTWRLSFNFLTLGMTYSNVLVFCLTVFVKWIIRDAFYVGGAEDGSEASHFWWLNSKIRRPSVRLQRQMKALVCSLTKWPLVCYSYHYFYFIFNDFNFNLKSGSLSVGLEIRRQHRLQSFPSRLYSSYSLVP